MYRSLHLWLIFFRPFIPRAFLRQEKGTATVEFVIWLPIVMLVFALVVDVSMVLGAEAQALRVVQDANRGLSVGYFLEIEDAKAFVLTQVEPLSSNATIDITVTNGVINSRLTMPAADLMATGFYDNLLKIDVTVVAEFLSEA